MYYYKTNNDIVEKYEVVFDREKLEQLRLDIINNCSTIKHHEYRGGVVPTTFDPLQIRNVQKRKINKQESEISPVFDLYLISYDEYIYPQLVLSIDRLLRGCTSAIDEIFDHDPDEYPTYKEQLIKLSAELDEIGLDQIEVRKNKIEEIEKFLVFMELNSKQKDAEMYYPAVKKLISLNLVDQISLSEIEHINTFLDVDVLGPRLVKKRKS